MPPAARRIRLQRRNRSPIPDPAKTGVVIEQTAYTLDALDNCSASLSFTTSADWTIHVTDDSADWHTITPASGPAGSQTVLLTARVNFGETERTARLEISCGEQPVPVTVAQRMTDRTDFTDQFDPAFADMLEQRKYISDAGKISRQDMAFLSEMTSLEIENTPDAQPTDLRGIEYFQSLRRLLCADVTLTELTLGNHPNLIELDCNSSSVTSLDVSGCKALTSLYCYNSELTELHIDGCTALLRVLAYGSKLKTLDASGCAALIVVECNLNQLTSLNVSGCTALEDLNCGYNQLPSLDISSCTALKRLFCMDNPGDGVSTFPITAWFDNTSIPANFDPTATSWSYDDKEIAIDFRKAE